MGKKAIEREAITLRFFRMMAHAFSRDLSDDELKKFKHIQKLFEDAMKPLKPDFVDSFMDMGRLAYKAEEERLEQQRKAA